LLCELCLGPYIFGFSAQAQLIVDSAVYFNSQESRYNGRCCDRITLPQWCRRHTEHSMHPTWVLSLRPLVEATGAFESRAVMLSLQARPSGCDGTRRRMGVIEHVIFPRNSEGLSHMLLVTKGLDIPHC
jgi:hypothetical protein